MKNISEEDLRIAVARIDERTQAINDQVKSIHDKLSSSYVLKEEFQPVKNIVYGLVGVLLSSIIISLAALVLK